MDLIQPLKERKQVIIFLLNLSGIFLCHTYDWRKIRALSGQSLISCAAVSVRAASLATVSASSAEKIAYATF